MSALRIRMQPCETRPGQDIRPVRCRGYPRSLPPASRSAWPSVRSSRTPPARSAGSRSARAGCGRGTRPRGVGQRSCPIPIARAEDRPAARAAASRSSAAAVDHEPMAHELVGAQRAARTQPVRPVRQHRAGARAARAARRPSTRRPSTGSGCGVPSGVRGASRATAAAGRRRHGAAVTARRSGAQRVRYAARRASAARSRDRERGAAVAAAARPRAPGTARSGVAASRRSRRRRRRRAREHDRRARPHASPRVVRRPPGRHLRRRGHEAGGSRTIRSISALARGSSNADAAGLIPLR